MTQFTGQSGLPAPRSPPACLLTVWSHDPLYVVSGYENQDWYIPSPALKPAETALTPDQIRETLNYFRKFEILFFLYSLRGVGASSNATRPSASGAGFGFRGTGQPQYLCQLGAAGVGGAADLQQQLTEWCQRAIYGGPIASRLEGSQLCRWCRGRPAGGRWKASKRLPRCCSYFRCDIAPRAPGTGGLAGPEEGPCASPWPSPWPRTLWALESRN